MRHLKLYHAIRLIQRCGSIRGAAAALSISPSALNRSIQGFEEELGFAIFDRLPGGVQLSDAGELLFDLIDRHLVEFGELQNQVGNLQSGETGELRISLGDDIAAGVVLDCVAETEGQLPGLSVEVLGDNTAQSLKDRRVQLAVLTNPATDDKTEVISAWKCRISGWQPIGEDPMPRALWELEDQRVILPPEGTGSRTAISHILRRNRLALQRLSTLSAPQVALRMGPGGPVALCPGIVFDGAFRAAKLRRLPVDLGAVQLCALRMNGYPLSRPAQVFLSVLERRLDDHALE